MDIQQYIASGIIEMYVLGLCSREEELEVESLRRQYPELNKAIEAYEEEMEKNMQQNSTLPGEETDKKILETLDSLHTPVISLEKAVHVERGTRWWRMAAAAAVLLLGISIVFNYILYKKNTKQDLALRGANGNLSTLPSHDYTILTDPAITPVAMYGVGIHVICRCTMYWDKKTGKAYIMIHHLPPSSSKHNYQLWAMVDGKPVSVGIINDEIRGRFIEMDNVPADAVAFSVTLEKAGGSEIPNERETYLRGNI